MSFAPIKLEQTGLNSYHVSHGEDKNLHVEFRTEPVYQGFESERQGRPIYKETPYIHIDFPGDRTKTIDRPVDMDGAGDRPSDPDRFPRQWESFKNKQEQVQDGFSITEWPPLSRSQALELKGAKIHTVEQLAALPDAALVGLGWRELREKAKFFLDSSKENTASSLIKENEDLRNDIKFLKEQMAELSSTVEKDMKRGPGRPPKQQGE
jgi:hypothetical protein